MSRRLKQAALVFIVIIAVSQLIRPDRTNPPTGISRTIQAQAGSKWRTAEHHQRRRAAHGRRVRVGVRAGERHDGAEWAGCAAAGTSRTYNRAYSSVVVAVAQTC
jgi:hypothetical protein